MQSTEFGRYLRSRREATDPASVGLPRTPGRRTSGLRREELAVLASIGVSWLTRLEQGRANRVSIAVLDRLAAALGLDSAERSHLFVLAGQREPAAADGSATLTDELRRLVDNLDPCPAYVLDEAWDLRCWNEAEAALFPVLDELAPGDPAANLLELLLERPALRAMMTDWPDEVGRLARQFRKHLAEHPTERGRSLARRLRDEHPVFARAWEGGDVAPFEIKQREFRVERGLLHFDHHRLGVTDHPGWLLVVYVPGAGSDTARRFAQVAAERRARRAGAG